MSSMMNSMALLEKCAEKFYGYDVEELKTELYKLVAKDPRNYVRIGEFLTEFANRNEYKFVYEFLLEVPIDLAINDSETLAIMMEDMPNALISSYGTYIKTRCKSYRAYTSAIKLKYKYNKGKAQNRDLELCQSYSKRRFIDMGTFIRRLGIKRIEFAEKIFFSPSNSENIIFA